MAGHPTTSNAAHACQARQQRLRSTGIGSQDRIRTRSSRECQSVALTGIFLHACAAKALFAGLNRASPDAAIAPSSNRRVDGSGTSVAWVTLANAPGVDTSAPPGIPLVCGTRENSAKVKGLFLVLPHTHRRQRGFHPGRQPRRAVRGVREHGHVRRAARPGAADGWAHLERRAGRAPREPRPVFRRFRSRRGLQHGAARLQITPG
jgi:hypothetical protein